MKGAIMQLGISPTQPWSFLFFDVMKLIKIKKNIELIKFITPQKRFLSSIRGRFWSNRCNILQDMHTKYNCKKYERMYKVK